MLLVRWMAREERRGEAGRRIEVVEGLVYDFWRSNVSSEKQDGCRDAV